MTPVDQYAVMGNPIAHSQSPVIHTLFAARTGENLHYRAILVEPGEFDRAVQRFYTSDQGRGLNITAPFKQQAWALADQLTDRAQLAGAVNTLWKSDDGFLNGDITDGIGLIRDITSNHGVDITGLKVLVVGAGGAVRGILEPLLEQQPEQVVIANRTVGRAEQLVQIFADRGHVVACGFGQAVGPFDLIINGTSTGLQGECPPLSISTIHQNTVVYDMTYGPGYTPFLRWAKSVGATRMLDGLGMLVEQAAESFCIWRGMRPDTSGVVEYLRRR